MRRPPPQPAGAAGPPDTRRGWLVVAICFVALAFTFGARSSVGMVLPSWRAELGWTASQSATGAELVLVMMAIGSPVAGNLFDRYGARPMFTLGLLALALGIGGTAFATEPFQYYLLFGVVGGVGWASVSIPLVTAAVSRHFTRLRGLAVGVAVSGASGGQLPVLSLLGAMIAAAGWRDTYLVLAALMAALAGLVALRFRDAPAPPAPAGAGHAGNQPESLRQRLGLLFRNRTFILLFAAFTLCGFTTAGVIDVYFIPYAIACGYSLVEGSAAYGVHGLGNLAGVVLFSWLADHVHRPRLLATMFFLRAAAFGLLLAISADIGLMFLFAAVFGILNFATFPVIANIVATHIGIRILGLTLGLLFGGHSLGAATGVAIGGWIFDLTARYDWIWWLSIPLAAFAGLFSLLVRETRRTRPVTAAAA